MTSYNFYLKDPSDFLGGKLIHWWGRRTSGGRFWGELWRQRATMTKTMRRQVAGFRTHFQDRV